MINKQIKILHLEDSQSDVDIVNHVLNKSKIEFASMVVDTRSDYINALNEFEPDLILSDHSLPAFNSLHALEILKQTGTRIPFILVTGAVSEEFAAQVIREGADDYILKDRPQRLPKAILNALEKYQLTEAKQKSEAQLRNFFEHSIDVLCTIDAGSRFVDVSIASELVWGYKPAELIGRKYTELVYNDDRLITGYAADDIMAGQIKTNFENRYVRKNGTVVPMVWSASWDAEAGLMYCVARDGTEKKLAEEKLRTSEANLSAIFENVGGSVYSIDTNLCYIAFNGTHKNAMKEVYDTDIKPGDKVHAFLEQTDPAGALEWEKIYTEALTGKPLQFVKDYSTPGQPYYLNFSINPIWQNHKVVGLSCVARNVTQYRVATNELRASEQRYRHITKNPILGIYWLSATGTILNANQAFCNMLGYTNLEIIDMHFSKLTHSKDNDEQARAVNQLFNGDIESYRCEKRYLTKAGEIFWGELILSTVKNDDDVVKSVIGVVQNITQRKNAESEIVALNDSLEVKIKERTAELQLANRQLESFNYTVSHDLQAPLRVVDGYAKILSKTIAHKLDADTREQFTVISTMIKRMSQLVKDLLAFSKGGKATVVKTDVNMNELVQAVASEIKMATPDGNYLLDLLYLPPAFCDPGLIRQVWTNLISNAVKYSKNNANPIVEVGSLVLHGQQTYYVNDNGAGFDMQHADKLFSAFQRLHSQAEFEGTGVGLATVHRIITGHGGRIWANGIVNQGATFYFTLPDDRAL